jgi:hypothetical protein
MMLCEFYNPYSLRGLAKRLGPPGRIADGTHEGQVYTRFDSPFGVHRLVPPGCRVVGSRGVRIATPAASMMKHPLGRRLFRGLERALCDSPFRYLGGFWIAAIEKG